MRVAVAHEVRLLQTRSMRMLVKMPKLIYQRVQTVEEDEATFNSKSIINAVNESQMLYGLLCPLPRGTAGVCLT